MRLKTITNGLLVFGAALLIGLPFLWSRQPGESAPLRSKQIYALQFGLYTLAIFVVAITVIVLAMVILRRTTRELKDQARMNMEVFVEGTLRDHEPPASNSPESPADDHPHG